MRTIVLSFLLVLAALSRAAVPAGAQTDPMAPKEAVTVEIDAGLLQRARALNMDLGAFLEAQLAAALSPVAEAPSASHATVVAAAFDTLEALLFAPLEIDENTSLATVRETCGTVIDHLGQLAVYAETRKSMAQPTTLEEVEELNQYLAGRFQALDARMGQVGNQVEASGKIMESKCPELDQNEQAAMDAMNTALGMYSPQAWCQAMMRKPQADWTMEDGGKFAQNCQGVTLE